MTDDSNKFQFGRIHFKMWFLCWKMWNFYFLIYNTLVAIKTEQELILSGSKSDQFINFSLLRCRISIVLEKLLFPQDPYFFQVVFLLFAFSLSRNSSLKHICIFPSQAAKQVPRVRLGRLFFWRISPRRCRRNTPCTQKNCPLRYSMVELFLLQLSLFQTEMTWFFSSCSTSRNRCSTQDVAANDTFFYCLATFENKLHFVSRSARRTQKQNSQNVRRLATFLLKSARKRSFLSTNQITEFLEQKLKEQVFSFYVTKYGKSQHFILCKDFIVSGEMFRRWKEHLLLGKRKCN